MSDKSKKLGSANDKPRVFSLSDFKNDNDGNSSDDEKQTYYAGGEKSGTAVQGGGKKDEKDFKEAREIMSKIFAKATSDDPTKKSTTLFSGSGKKLNESSSPKSSTAVKSPEPKIATVDLIFWSDGFTIGQGPLRPYDDSEGLRLLDNLRNGTISAEDLGIDPYELADVKIVQLPNEVFSPARREQITKKKPDDTAIKRPSFTGIGEKLGSDDSETVCVNKNAELDPAITNTRIQIVLPNGSRKVINISPRIKVSDLYSQIRKEINLPNFVLKIGNPTKLIPEDLDASIFQIGLINASIFLAQI